MLIVFRSIWHVDYIARYSIPSIAVCQDQCQISCLFWVKVMFWLRYVPVDLICLFRTFGEKRYSLPKWMMLTIIVRFAFCIAFYLEAIFWKLISNFLHLNFSISNLHVLKFTCWMCNICAQLAVTKIHAIFLDKLIWF